MPHLKLGFIKLSDMAPLAIAYEKRFFEDEGLVVTLEPQGEWKALLDRVIDGELDGAHMLSGQPLAATIGCTTCWMNGSRQWTQAHVVTPLSMDLNGNGITVSNEVWAMMKPGLPMGPDGRPEHPIKADHLKPGVEKSRMPGRPFKWGRVPPVKKRPEKFFGRRVDFIARYPNRAGALPKALTRAAIGLDAGGTANRREAAEILARPEYVGADADVIAKSMTGT